MYIKIYEIIKQSNIFWKLSTFCVISSFWIYLFTETEFYIF